MWERDNYVRTARYRRDKRGIRWGLRLHGLDGGGVVRTMEGGRWRVGGTRVPSVSDLRCGSVRTVCYRRGKRGIRWGLRLRGLDGGGVVRTVEGGMWRVGGTAGRCSIC